MDSPNGQQNLVGFVVYFFAVPGGSRMA